MKAHAKALTPFLASLILAGAQWALTGAYDAAEIQTNVLGLAGALLVWLVPNKQSERGQTEPLVLLAYVLVVVILVLLVIFLARHLA